MTLNRRNSLNTLWIFSLWVLWVLQVEVEQKSVKDYNQSFSVLTSPSQMINNYKEYFNPFFLTNSLNSTKKLNPFLNHWPLQLSIYTNEFLRISFQFLQNVIICSIWEICLKSFRDSIKSIDSIVTVNRTWLEFGFMSAWEFSTIDWLIFRIGLTLKKLLPNRLN